MAGWIKLHRDLANHWVSGDPESLAVFVRLLMEANFVDTTQNINGRPTTVRRGDLLFGLPAFSARSGVSISKLRRVMDNLKRDGMIRRQNFSKYSIVSIVSYEQWQSEDRQTAGRKQAGSRQTTTPEEGEKGNKGKSKPHCAKDDAFELFWGAGLRKAVKVKARPIFDRLAAQHGDPMEFARMLADDIASRKAAGQLGFDKLMPTTYLNQKRWEDEPPSDCPHLAIVDAWNEELPAHVQPVDHDAWSPGSTGRARLEESWEILKCKPRSKGDGMVIQDAEQGARWFRAVFRRLAKSPRLLDETSAQWCKMSWAVKNETIHEIAQGAYDQ